jgi:hypothetical protein
MIGKRIVLTKEKQLHKGAHPNGFSVGYKLAGYVKDFKIGEQLYLYPTLKGLFMPHAWTSKIVSLDETTMLLTTENSVYSLKFEE